MQDSDINVDVFARMVVDALEAAGVEYMLGGAIAAWAWGEVHSTMDVDVVVNLPDHVLAPLSEELMKRGMTVPPDIMRDNIAETRIDLPINAIHPFSGNKAELFPLRPGDELRESALKRRVMVDLGGALGKVYVHAPEDLILYKLQYYVISRQTKHARDIGSILASDYPLDMAYLTQWVERLGLVAVWQEIRRQ